MVLRETGEVSRRGFLSQNPEWSFSSTRLDRGRVGGGETTELLDGDGECVDGVANEGLNSFALGLNTNSFALGSNFFGPVVGGLTTPGSTGVGLATGDGIAPGLRFMLAFSFSVNVGPGGSIGDVTTAG